MSSKISRRSLARWAGHQLEAGQDVESVVKHLAAVLISSHRENQAGMLADDIAYELEAAGKLSSATVTSRYPLNDQIRAALTGAIAAATSTARVQLDEQLNEDVIGGLRVNTATRTWDLTVAHQLNELRKVL